MRRTVLPQSIDGLREFLHGMRRDIDDLQRVRNPPPSYVEADSCCGGQVRQGTVVSLGTFGSGTSPWGSLPTGWTDGDAHWIWHTAMASGSRPNGEEAWLYGAYESPTAVEVTIEASVDNSGTLYLNGAALGAITEYDDGRSVFTATLRVGSNVFSAHCVNGVAGSDPSNPAGFIMSVRDTATSTVLFRTSEEWGSTIEQPSGWPSPSVSSLYALDELTDVDTAGAANGDALVYVSATGSWGPAPVGASASLPWFDVTDYGAVGDGVTDDTATIQATIDAAVAAGGGVVFFPAGVYIVAGALQDTANANAQLLLPSIDYVDTEQVTIEFRGAFPPPPVMSVIGTTPVPDGHSVIKSTLAAGTGALLGGRVAAGSLDNFTNVMFRASDIAFRTVANPTITALNLSRVAAVDIDRVVVDTGSYYVQGLAEPTTATSYGLRLPANNNGAYTRLGAVNVIGFYNGYEFGEHSNGEQLTAWGCKRAFMFPTATNHASHFKRLMAVHCERGMVFTGYHPVTVEQFNIEHAASGWWVTDFDIDDASNFGVGDVTWHVVLASVGPDDTFTVNGATNLNIAQLGADPSGLTLIDDDTFATASATTAASSESIKAYVDAQVAGGGGGGERWELVVDGSVPPANVTNEAGDDWLYVATIDDTDVTSLLLAVQAVDPAPPDAGLLVVYLKADGLYSIDDVGTVTKLA